MSASKFIDVAAVDEIPEGQGRAFEVDGRIVAVFRLKEGCYAIEDACPHMGASLAPGAVENCVVACPWHAWRFDVRDGAWVENRRLKIDAFDVKVEAGRVWVSSNKKDIGDE
ncbi:MAG: nitrite reductase small subunit NirD [Pirellulaceae bacterium]